MSAFSFIAWKFKYELDRLSALARYPLHRDALIARLSGSMPGLRIEPVNICNANCTFCAYQYQTRPTGTMSMDLFRKVIDEYVECGGGGVGLTPTVGDPLVDPHLLERIAYARSKPEITSIGMYSNMIALEHHGVAALIASGLTALTVSVSGLEESMYRRVYRSKQYPRVLKNILEFARANNAAGRPVTFNLELRTDRSVRESYGFADHKQVEALVGAENIDMNFFFDNWAGKIKQDDLTGTMKLRRRRRLTRPRISPCSELFSGPFVAWDGKVVACSCRDVDMTDLVIGDANSQHIGDIWFGDQIKKLRDEFLTDKIRPICDSCTHYNNISHLLSRHAASFLDSVKPSPYREKREK